MAGFRPATQPSPHPHRPTKNVPKYYLSPRRSVKIKAGGMGVFGLLNVDLSHTPKKVSGVPVMHYYADDGWRYIGHHTTNYLFRFFDNQVGIHSSHA